MLYHLVKAVLRFPLSLVYFSAHSFITLFKPHYVSMLFCHIIHAHYSKTVSGISESGQGSSYVHTLWVPAVLCGLSNSPWYSLLS